MQLAATRRYLDYCSPCLPALLHRNLPQIRLTNGSLQTQFAAQLAENLPPNGIIISDDGQRLWLLQNWLARHGRAKITPCCIPRGSTAPKYSFLPEKLYPNGLLPKLPRIKLKFPTPPC